MNIKLEPIQLKEDKTKEIYASEDCQSLLQMWEDYYPKIGFKPPWVGYFVKSEDKIIGCCSFSGAPLNNRVEISYWTFKEYEGQGIATKSCKTLIAIAKKENPSVLITAKTAPENNASTNILQKSGFVFTGIVQDHEIGDAWEWELQ